MVTFDSLSTRKAAIDSGKYLYRVLRNWQNSALITVVASLVSLVLVSTSSFAQFSVPTSHGDNARTGANILPGDLETQALAGTGNDRTATVEANFHWLSPFIWNGPVWRTPGPGARPMRLTGFVRLSRVPPR